MYSACALIKSLTVKNIGAALDGTIFLISNMQCNVCVEIPLNQENVGITIFSGFWGHHQVECNYIYNYAYYNNEYPIGGNYMSDECLKVLEVLEELSDMSLENVYIRDMVGTIKSYTKKDIRTFRPRQDLACEIAG